MSTSWLQTRREQQRWLRDRVQEIYSNCLYYLSSAYPYVPRSLEEESEIEYHKLRVEGAKLRFEHRREARKWLDLLLVYHPAKDSEAFAELQEKVMDFFRVKSGVTESELRADIRWLAERDPRLQSITLRERASWCLALAILISIIAATLIVSSR